MTSLRTAGTAVFTLRIQKVTDGNRVVAVDLNFSLLKHRPTVPVGADAHVLLSEMTGLIFEAHGIL